MAEPQPPRESALRAFRLPFWRLFVVFGVPIQLSVAPLLVIKAFQSPAELVSLIVPGAQTELFALTFLAALCRLLQQLFPVKLSADGLMCADSLGWNRMVRWEQMTAVRRVSLPLAPMARISHATLGVRLWLPLFVEDFDEFAELAAQYAGPGHPLTAVLNAEGAFRSS